MKQDIVARLIYASWAFTLAMMAMWSPCTPEAFMVRNDGAAGSVIALMTGLLGLVIMLDARFNDLLRVPRLMTWAQCNRHWLYMLAAFCYVVPLFHQSAQRLEGGDLFGYLSMAAFGPVLSFREVMAKRRAHKEAPCAN